MADFVPERLKALKENLAARKGMKGFEENVRQIEAEIQRIETTGTAEQALSELARLAKRPTQGTGQ